MIFYRKIKSLNFTSWEKRQRLKKNFVLSFSVFCYDEQKKKKRTEKLLSTRFKEFYHRRRQRDRKMRGGGQGEAGLKRKGTKEKQKYIIFRWGCYTIQLQRFCQDWSIFKINKTIFISDIFFFL